MRWIMILLVACERPAAAPSIPDAEAPAAPRGGPVTVVTSTPVPEAAPPPPPPTQEEEAGTALPTTLGPRPGQSDCTTDDTCAPKECCGPLGPAGCRARATATQDMDRCAGIACPRPAFRCACERGKCITVPQRE